MIQAEDTTIFSEAVWVVNGGESCRVASGVGDTGEEFDARVFGPAKTFD